MNNCYEEILKSHINKIISQCDTANYPAYTDYNADSYSCEKFFLREGK